jgi:hypothetical protein
VEDEATPVIIQDSAEIKNVLVQLNFKTSQVVVISNYSAWDNMGYLLEGVGITVAKCVKEGIPRKAVLKELKNYLSKVLANTMWVD